MGGPGNGFGASATLARCCYRSVAARVHAFELTQGVEMGRPSLLQLTARRSEDGIRATVGGGCVPVLRGEAQL